MFLWSLIVFLAASDCVLARTKPDFGCVLSNSDTSIPTTFTRIYVSFLSEFENLNDSFDTSLPAPQAGNMFGKLVLKYAESIGVPEDEAHLLSQEINQTFIDTFDVFTPCAFGEVYGLAVARYLDENGILKQENYVELAISYGQSAYNWTQSDYDSGGSFDHVAYAFADFYRMVGLFDAEHYPGAIETFDDTMYYMYDLVTGSSTDADGEQEEEESSDGEEESSGGEEESSDGDDDEGLTIFGIPIWDPFHIFS